MIFGAYPYMYTAGIGINIISNQSIPKMERYGPDDLSESPIKVIPRSSSILQLSSPPVTPAQRKKRGLR